MRITFCGTAAGAFTGDRSSSGLMIQGAQHTIMLDCGPGALRGAMQARIELQTIEALVLSHLHADHVLDLVAWDYLRRSRVAPLPPVYGPPGTAGALEAVRTFARNLAAAALAPVSNPPALPAFTALDAIEIAGSDVRKIAGFMVQSEVTPHAPQVIAAARRFSADRKSIVFSGDTLPNPATLVPLSEGADLLIHECYSEERLQRAMALLDPDGAEQLYRRVTSTHTEVLHAAAIARDAGVPRLVLTHLGRGEAAQELRAKAATVFSGEITVAYDGLVCDM